MKVSLRHLLICCLLLGAVGLPIGWHVFGRWKAAEIEQLEQQLREMDSEAFSQLRFMPGDHPKWSEFQQRQDRINTRLQQLKGD